MTKDPFCPAFFVREVDNNVYVTLEYGKVEKNVEVMARVYKGFPWEKLNKSTRDTLVYRTGVKKAMAEGFIADDYCDFCVKYDFVDPTHTNGFGDPFRGIKKYDNGGLPLSITVSIAGEAQTFGRFEHNIPHDSPGGRGGHSGLIYWRPIGDPEPFAEKGYVLANPVITPDRLDVASGGVRYAWSGDNNVSKASAPVPVGFTEFDHAVNMARKTIHPPFSGTFEKGVSFCVLVVNDRWRLTSARIAPIFHDGTLYTFKCYDAQGRPFANE